MCVLWHALEVHLIHCPDGHEVDMLLYEKCLKRFISSNDKRVQFRYEEYEYECAKTVITHCNHGFILRRPFDDKFYIIF